MIRDRGGSSSLRRLVLRAGRLWRLLQHAQAAQGETTKATNSEKSMAAEAPTGMGRMYGPIRPRTKAMGRIAAMTANVASMVGLPTSSTASTATSRERPPVVLGQLEMAVDVLHHHDRVVHQDADAEDQGEQRDAVEGVAEK